MNSQPVDVLAVMLADALAAEDWRVLKTGDRNGASARKFSDEARAAVAELVTEFRQLIADADDSGITAHYKGRGFDESIERARAALARVQGGAA